MIIGRLIPAGTGYNAYEDPTLASVDADYAAGGAGMYGYGDRLDPEFEQDDPLDVVLDDRTARAYNLEERTSFGAAPSSIDPVVDDEVEDFDDFLSDDVDAEE